MRTTRPAFATALHGVGAACLLLTIAFLAVAPANRFDYPKLECGTPALWYLNGQTSGSGLVDKVAPLPAPVPLAPTAGTPPTCHEIVDARLRLAGESATATIALFAASSMVSRRSTRRDRRGPRDWNGADLTLLTEYA